MSGLDQITLSSKLCTNRSLSIIQSINQSINQLTNQSINQSISQLTNQPMNQSEFIDFRRNCSYY